MSRWQNYLDFIKMPPIKRFTSLTEEEINDLTLKVQNKSTTSSDKKWEKVFKDFLTENEIDDDFYAFDTETLNKRLSKLWFGACQNNKEHTRYRANSLRSMWYSLNHCLKKSGKTFDITTSPELLICQSAFTDAMKELKSLGFYYEVNHTEIIPALIHEKSEHKSQIIKEIYQP